jgi:hypothetical protein
VVSSEQAGPHNMMLTATRVNGEGEAAPFTIFDNGLVAWGVEKNCQGNNG